MSAQIIAATVVRLHHTATVPCAECGNPVMRRALRVLYKEDESVGVAYYHPEIDEDDEIRGCAPDHATTRAALARRIA